MKKFLIAFCLLNFATCLFAQENSELKINLKQGDSFLYGLSFELNETAEQVPPDNKNIHSLNIKVKINGTLDLNVMKIEENSKYYITLSFHIEKIEYFYADEKYELTLEKSSPVKDTKLSSIQNIVFLHNRTFKIFLTDKYNIEKIEAVDEKQPQQKEELFFYSNDCLRIILQNLFGSITSQKISNNLKDIRRIYVVIPTNLPIEAEVEQRYEVEVEHIKVNGLYKIPQIKFDASKLPSTIKEMHTIITSANSFQRYNIKNGLIENASFDISAKKGLKTPSADCVINYTVSHLYQIKLLEKEK